MESRYEKMSKDVKAKYIISSLKWLALKPQLLEGVKTDKDLIYRVEQFAKELCEFDRDSQLY